MFYFLFKKLASNFNSKIKKKNHYISEQHAGLTKENYGPYLGYGTPVCFLGTRGPFIRVLTYFQFIIQHP